MARIKAPERHNNPGSISLRGKLIHYPTLERGYIALNSLLLRRYNKLTPLQIFKKYAPEYYRDKNGRLRKTGNNPLNYAKIVVAEMQKQGFNVDINSVMDFTDPKIRGAFCVGISQGESSKILGPYPTEKENIAYVRQIAEDFSLSKEAKLTKLKTRDVVSGRLVKSDDNKTKKRAFMAKLRDFEKAVDLRDIPQDTRLAEAKTLPDQKAQVTRKRAKSTRPTARNNYNNPGQLCSLRTRRPIKYSSLEKGYEALADCLKKSYSNLTCQEIWKKFTGLKRADGDKLMKVLKEQGVIVSKETKLDLKDPRMLASLTYAVATLRSGGKPLGGEIEARECIASALGVDMNKMRMAENAPAPDHLRQNAEPVHASGKVPLSIPAKERT